MRDVALPRRIFHRLPLFSLFLFSCFSYPLRCVRRSMFSSPCSSSLLSCMMENFLCAYFLYTVCSDNPSLLFLHFFPMLVFLASEKRRERRKRRGYIIIFVVFYRHNLIQWEWVDWSRFDQSGLQRGNVSQRLAIL